MRKVTLVLFSLLFTVGLLSQDPTITSFTLVNADSNADIMEITEGVKINLNEYAGITFNIRANTSGNTGSVTLRVSGPLSKTMTESVAPYALFGDFPVGDYYGEVLPIGSYTISGTPYSEASAGGIAGTAHSFNFQVVIEPVQRPFITTWKTDNPGVSGDNQVTIFTKPSLDYNYSIDWGDGTMIESVNEAITHTYPTPGTYQIKIYGDFPSISFGYGINGGTDGETDRLKLIEVNQWGSQEWLSLFGGFQGCANLNVSATDIPNLTKSSSISFLFKECESLVYNTSISRWDVSNIKYMSGTFYECGLFNQDISDWDTKNVINISGMFSGAALFNQPIGSWNTGRVEEMDALFARAQSFNQPLNDWDIGNVNSLRTVFFGASSFNFPLDNWKVTQVVDMTNLFNGATAFDQDLSSWDVAQVQNMIDMFRDSGLSVDSYDLLLNSWSNQALQNGVNFNAGSSQFCQSEAARQKLIEDFGWTITDGGKAADCEEPQRPFITTWKTDNPGVSDDNQITIPTFEGEVYDYTVHWGDGTSDTGVTGDITHTYEIPGTYEVSIRGTFPRIYFGLQTDSDKLLFINQWGDIVWSSMDGAFFNCTRMDVLATDIPDLTLVSNMDGMFGFCPSMKGNSSFANWDVSNVTSIRSLFAFSDFNQDIGNWDTSNVESMFAVFIDTPFNQDISRWNTSKVTDTRQMFSETPFNQELSNWDVSNVTDMNGMFEQSSFDQNIADWDIGKVTDLSGMFFGSGLSSSNYDSTLIAWSGRQVQNGVKFDAGFSQFCSGQAARQKLIDDFGWTITDGGRAEDCEEPQRPFITTWKTDNPGSSENNQITIPTLEGEVYDYTVDWGDGTSNTGVTGDITHTYAASGTYQVSISGDFPAIYFGTSFLPVVTDKQKILSVDQWGDIEWKVMTSAFEGCENMDVLAADMPNLSEVEKMNRMFSSSGLIGNEVFNNWDTSNIKDMSICFVDTPFNQDISGWDVSNVVSMSSMFALNEVFNQDISGWDVSKVTDMSSMFYNAVAFDQDVGSWNISNVSDMVDMFEDSGLSTDNYDKLLIGWSTQQVLDNVEFDAGSSQFCGAGSPRQKLIDEFGWIITDGGLSADCDFCPTTQITLTTQQQVDDFAATYDLENCSFEGGILIQGSDIVNLDGMSGLTYVAGFLKIVDTGISNLQGLSSLTTVGGLMLVSNNNSLIKIDGLSSSTFFSSLEISNNDSLADINGLSSLDTVGHFSISDNKVLVNIEGLTSLTRVSGDLVIRNNAVLESLDGFLALQVVADDLVIENNALLTNLDGLSSLVLVDNNLTLVSNPVLTNIDGLSNLTGIGESIIIQSNPALSNLDGMSSVDYVNYDVNIMGNPVLMNISGLGNLSLVGGDFSIMVNATLSECAVNAVCDSENVVTGSITISGNTGNCTDLITAKDACSELVEVNADLLEATYLQGNFNPMPKGSLLRVEENNRKTYLKFDLSEVDGTINEARLEMQVASDPGNGIVEVFLGSNSTWTETGLNGNNKPLAVGNALAAINGTHSVGQVKSWNLDVSSWSPGDELTLIVTHRNGNDVAFASDETTNAPKLLVSYSNVPEPERPFISTWKTDNPGNPGESDRQITIKTRQGRTYNYTVDWGDGNVDSVVTDDIVHTYDEPGTYTVTMSGDFPILFQTEKLLTVNQWGSRPLGFFPSFQGCSNMDIIATDIPDFSETRSVESMFENCNSLIGNPTIGDWDVGEIHEFDSLFKGATSFNQDISRWNISSGRDLENMFNGATSFNQDIGQWIVSGVGNFVSMFSGATSFNQDLSDWDVSSASWLSGMFASATSFDQDLSAWRIENVTNMIEMFAEVKLSNENYDAILSSWSRQNVKSGLQFDGGNSQYCLAESARQKLIDEFGWTITDGGKAEDCVLIVEGEADLVHATYLEGTNNPKPNGTLLRVEQGIRETYLKFDMTDFAGTITEARLEMQVASDPGNGILEVFLGSNSDWTETGLNGSNKPLAVGGALAAVNGIHSVGQTKIWNLDVASLSVGGELTLIVKHRSGNDVAFASDESFNAPRLIVTTSSNGSLGSGASLSGLLRLLPNPAVHAVQVSFVSPEGVKLVSDIRIYDTTGRLVRTVSADEADRQGAFEIDVRSLESGIYFIRSVDENGVPYQKQMAIKR